MTCAVNIPRSIVNSLKPVLEHPVCTCGAHMVWSRVRLSMLNDPQRNTLLLKALRQVRMCVDPHPPLPWADHLLSNIHSVLWTEEWDCVTLWSECCNALFVLSW